jgi:hypothetical protein
MWQTKNKPSKSRILISLAYILMMDRFKKKMNMNFHVFKQVKDLVTIPRISMNYFNEISFTTKSSPREYALMVVCCLNLRAYKDDSYIFLLFFFFNDIAYKTSGKKKL